MGPTMSNGRCPAIEAEADRVGQLLRAEIEAIADELWKPAVLRSAERVRPALARLTATKTQLFALTHQIATAIDANMREGALDPSRKGQLEMDTHRLRGLQSAALYWNSRFAPVERAVEAQLDPVRTPLYAPDPLPAAPGMAILSAQIDLLDRALLQLDFLANPTEQSDVAESLGAFSDIRLTPSYFAEHVHAAHRLWLAQRKRREARFLDVGCGGGVKVMMAASYFDRPDGLEVDPGYAAAARRMMETLELERAEVIEADALSFDGFDAYDVLYFYQPMRFAEELHQLEARIADQARPGAILIAPYSSFHDRAPGLDCAHVAGRIYLAKSTTEEAIHLREEAEAIGHAVVRKPNAVPWARIWKPILNASAANGVEV